MLHRYRQEDEEDAAELKLGASFQNIHCIMNCEVKILLERIKEQRYQAGAHPMNPSGRLLHEYHQFICGDIDIDA